MSALFLGVRAPKLLLLAGTDRLDRDLTIGQMQGRFQLALLPKARSLLPCCDMSPMFWQRMTACSSSAQRPQRVRVRDMRSVRPRATTTMALWTSVQRLCGALPQLKRWACQRLPNQPKKPSQEPMAV